MNNSLSHDQINELDNDRNIDHDEGEDDVDDERFRLMINGMSQESVKRKMEQQIDKKQCKDKGELICGHWRCPRSSNSNNDRYDWW